MTVKFSDIFDQPLEVGDRVAVAFPDGRSSAVLRIGKVHSFYEKLQPDRWVHREKRYIEQPPIQKIVIEWDDEASGGYTPDKPSKVELARYRFMKIK